MWVTAQGGAVDHAVTQLDLGRWATELGPGLPSICGERFWPAPMIAEPGLRCFRCVRYLRARATLRDAEERLAGLPRDRRESIIRRFLAAVVPAKAPVASPHPPRGASPGDAIGPQSRRDSDALPTSVGSDSRRARTFRGGV